MYLHAVRTFSLTSKIMYESYFNTAEEAYNEYVNCIQNAKRNLPKGHGIVVVRYKNNNVMTAETIIN